MDDPLDALLDARLREETAYIDDAGFTTHVLQELPPRPRSFATQRSLIILLASVISVIVAYFASDQGLFVREAFLRASQLTAPMIFAGAFIVGMFFTGVALWASLDRTRDPLR